MKRRFWKLSGAGNDFILLEGLGPLSGTALAQKLCSRRHSIGADGLLIARRSPLSIDYFNADGSRAFCGNGTRCAAWWMKSRGWSGPNLTLRTSQGLIQAKIVGRERARIAMPLPTRLRWDLRLKATSRFWRVHALVVGVPHAVVEVTALDRFPVVQIGRELRRHPAFGSAGTNVNFVERTPRGLAVRTFERGVEDETLACGTGAVASAFWANAFLGSKKPLRVATHGGDVLTAGFVWKEDRLEEAWLEGPAKITFTGEVQL